MSKTYNILLKGPKFDNNKPGVSFEASNQEDAELNFIGFLIEYGLSTEDAELVKVSE